MHPAIAAVARSTGLRRHHIAAARMRGEREFLARFRIRASERDRSRILCYHGVGTPSWGVNDVTSKQFAEQLEVALSLGYRFVSLEDAVGRPVPKTLAVTFDDGLASVSKNAAPVLSDLGVPFTVFVVSDWADGKHNFGDDIFMDWSDLQRLVGDGAAIGSHSVNHPNFSRISADEAVMQLRTSRETISARLGLAPDAFAIPFGRSSDWTAATSESAALAGYDMVVAQSEDARPPGTVPRTFVAGSDTRTTFRAALEGAFDDWEEWW